MKNLWRSHMVIRKFVLVLLIHTSEILSHSIFECNVAHEQLNFYDNKPPKAVLNMKIFLRENIPLNLHSIYEK